MKFVYAALLLGFSLLGAGQAHAGKREPASSRTVCGRAVDSRSDDMWPSGRDVHFTPDQPFDGAETFALHAANTIVQEFLDNIQRHQDRVFFVCVSTIETVQQGIDSVDLRIYDIYNN